jgi:FKBP-type peptidyl-prolyl cis-trans isomerase (trigger factor)
MKNIIKDIDGCRKEMQVTAEWSDISGDYDDVVAGYAQAGLPGFRPGKSPRALVERKYKAKIEEDAQDRSARRIFKEVIYASGIDFTGAAEVSDISFIKGESLTFKAVFTVVPEFELPDYKEYKSGNSSGDDAEDELTNYLLENTNIHIPESMVDYELNFSDENEAEGDARKSAEERVKLLFILKKIAGIEGIEVKDVDVDERIKAMAAEYEVTVKELWASLEQNHTLSRIKSFLLAEQTIAYLLEA